MTAVGYEAEASLIRARFEEQWDPRVPVNYPNMPDNKPAARTAWLRLSILPTDARVASIGGPAVRYRHDGDIIAEIHAPENQGSGPALALADDVCAAFRAWRSGELIAWAPRVVVVGNRDGWYVVNVIAPYQRDETFSNP